MSWKCILNFLGFIVCTHLSSNGYPETQLLKRLWIFLWKAPCSTLHVFGMGVTCKRCHATSNMRRKKKKRHVFCELKSLFFFLLFSHYFFSFALQRWFLEHEVTLAWGSHARDVMQHITWEEKRKKDVFCRYICFEKC